MAAREVLPPACFSFPFSVEVKAPSGQPMTVEYRQSGVSIPPNLTGEFSDTTDYFELDFGARLDALFVGWNEMLREWENQPLTDCRKFKIAAMTFIQSIVHPSTINK